MNANNTRILPPTVNIMQTAITNATKIDCHSSSNGKTGLISLLCMDSVGNVRLKSLVIWIVPFMKLQSIELSLVDQNSLLSNNGR